MLLYYRPAMLGRSICPVILTSHSHHREYDINRYVDASVHVSFGPDTGSRYCQAQTYRRKDCAAADTMKGLFTVRHSLTMWYYQFVVKRGQRH